MKKRYLTTILLIALTKLSFCQTWGINNSRTDTRDDAGLRGDAGAVSGFFQTENPVNFPSGANSWWHLLDVRHNNPANNYAMQFAGSFFDQNLYFRKVQDNASQDWSKVVTENNGRIGLGTSSPIQQLHMVGSGDAGGMVLVQNTSPNFYSGMNMLTEQGGLGASFQYGNSQVNELSNTFFFGNRSGGATHIISGLYPQILMTVLSGGNVGIGITNPQNKLDVNGTIHSKKVTIDLTGWSDYVFEKNYTLPSLKELKTYIDENHHLPGLPSEKELVKSGLDVAEMNKTLTKKVEELTLYILKMNEEIEKLKAQVNTTKAH